VNQRTIADRPAQDCPFSSAIRPQTQRLLGPVQAALAANGSPIWYSSSGIKIRPCPGLPPVLKICINMAYLQGFQNASMPVQTPEHSSTTTSTGKIWWGLPWSCAEWPFIPPGISIDPQRVCCSTAGKGARFFNRSPAVALVLVRALRRPIPIALSARKRAIKGPAASQPRKD